MVSIRAKANQIPVGNGTWLMASNGSGDTLDGHVMADDLPRAVALGPGRINPNDTTALQLPSTFPGTLYYIADGAANHDEDYIIANTRPTIALTTAGEGSGTLDWSGLTPGPSRFQAVLVTSGGLPSNVCRLNFFIPATVSAVTGEETGTNTATIGAAINAVGADSGITYAALYPPTADPTGPQIANGTGAIWTGSIEDAGSSPVSFSPTGLPSGTAMKPVFVHFNGSYSAVVSGASFSTDGSLVINPTLWGAGDYFDVQQNGVAAASASGFTYAMCGRVKQLAAVTSLIGLGASYYIRVLQNGAIRARMNPLIAETDKTSAATLADEDLFTVLISQSATRLQMVVNGVEQHDVTFDPTTDPASMKWINANASTGSGSTDLEVRAYWIADEFIDVVANAAGFATGAGLPTEAMSNGQAIAGVSPAFARSTAAIGWNGTTGMTGTVVDV